MIQEWTVTAPPDVAWTPDELRQIGEALRALQSRLPGRYPQVTLDRVLIIPRDEPAEAAIRAGLPPAMMSSMCSCGDIQPIAEPGTGNLFVPHVDAKTGEPCRGLPLAGYGEDVVG